ncbi:putative glycosyl transferase, family 14 [Lupinus albus]|uniref:Putative glycosyl transferase, family 14 n=1 Tax=Lupinus albus TaxID=3870 RepID=A0A6A4PQS4_LUPAL|nr:putative glycosyl transferase, family 14 [Lupinus albus]
MVGSRKQQITQKGPTWIIVLVCLACLFLIALFINPLLSHTAVCKFFPTQACRIHNHDDMHSNPFPRELTDNEIESRVVVKEMLKFNSVRTKTSKVAFLFMTPGSLPFEKLWHKFFQGHEGKFSIYVHASKEKPVHVSRYFVGREIHSEPVGWGKFSMVEAEKRLLAHALLDPDNQHFALLSESCIPVRHFEFVYNYLLFTNVSFIECYIDPGPHGNGRYIHHMLPEVEEKDFRKGSQWFTMKRQHAIIVMADSLYFTKFKYHCRVCTMLLTFTCLMFFPLLIAWTNCWFLSMFKHVQPGMEGGRNCYSDEHYLPTFLNMVDPGGIANWSVTYVDWSEGKWHPRSFSAQDITSNLMKYFTKTVLFTPCMWNGSKRPCYLFARKFYPETIDKLIHLFSNSSSS